jgi:hypothetical protein
MSSAANILPDPGKLGDCMELSYKELRSAARKRPATKRKSTKPGAAKNRPTRKKS